MPRYFRKVIRVCAEDSPNVRLGLAQQRAGIEPTDEILVPGVLTFGEYRTRRATWDKIRQCVGLDGMFWEGAEVMLFPPEWRSNSERLARRRLSERSQGRRWIGCDPAEGGDKSAWSVIDAGGLVKLVSLPTPDTTVVVSQTLKLMREHNVQPQDVIFDRGGGGKEHADRLHQMGFPVRSIGFGEAVALEPKRGLRLLEERKEGVAERYAFVNRRAQMYFELRQLIDPANAEHPQGFAIPFWLHPELTEQMRLIPLTYDAEGRIKLLPKSKRTDSAEDSKVKTLTELIGHSPDELDSLVLACHARLHRASVQRAGVGIR